MQMREGADEDEQVHAKRLRKAKQKREEDIKEDLLLQEAQKGQEMVWKLKQEREERNETQDFAENYNDPDKPAEADPAAYDAEKPQG